MGSLGIGGLGLGGLKGYVCNWMSLAVVLANPVDD